MLGARSTTLVVTSLVVSFGLFLLLARYVPNVPKEQYMRSV